MPARLVPNVPTCTSFPLYVAAHAFPWLCTLTPSPPRPQLQTAGPMEGCTALYAACRAGFVDTVRLLLENGMDPALQAVCGAP